MPYPAPTTLLSIGPELWSSYAAFNGQAYPDHLGSIANSCAIRLALLMMHSDQLSAMIEHERQSLTHEFLVDPSKLTELVVANPNQPFIAQADGIAYTSALYSVLNTTKSFLDVYADVSPYLSST